MDNLSSTSVCSSTNLTGGDHKLNNLPDEIYDFHLFKHLNLPDLFNLKLTSKSLYNIVDSYQIKELFVVDYDNMLPIDECERHPNFKNIKYQIDCSKFGLLLSNLPNLPGNLINLKALRIYAYGPISIKLEDLNKFTKLQILHLERVRLIVTNVHLQLTDLKELTCLPDKHAGFNRFVIDASNLQRLEFNDYLSIDVSIIKNLEYLTVNFWNENGKLRILDDIQKLKNLKKLRFNNFPKNEVVKLVDLFKSKKDDLEIVVCGVKINEINKIIKYQGIGILRYLPSNYEELDDELDFIVKFDYADDVDRNQPANFFNKYNNIQKITIWGRIRDENRLINFIRECKELKELCLRKTDLSQQFFNQLPVISSLYYLDMDHSRRTINFDFLINMTSLRRLNTDQDIELNRILNLVNLKYLKSFAFFANNGFIKIIKESRDKYSIDYFGNLDGLPDQEYYSYDELIEWRNYVRGNE